MEENKITQTEEKKVWQVFACIGFGVGIGSIATFLFYSLTITTAIIGIVFSALGLKSKQYHGKALTGLILSIIAEVLALLVAFVIIFAAIASEM